MRIGVSKEVFALFVDIMTIAPVLLIHMAMKTESAQKQQAKKQW